jgi:hypothetical protein
MLKGLAYSLITSVDLTIPIRKSAIIVIIPTIIAIDLNIRCTKMSLAEMSVAVGQKVVYMRTNGAKFALHS